MTVLKIIRYCLFAIGVAGLLTFLFAIIASLISLAKKNKKGVLRFSNISVLAFVIMIFFGSGSFALRAKLESKSLDLEKLPDIKIESSSLMAGTWDQEIGKEAGSNLSPDLKWEPVEGCNWYAVIMIDHDAREFLHWVCFTDKTHLELGEYGLDTGYVGPYPPAKHNYEIYVVAMQKECEGINYKLDASGANLIWMVEAMDKKADTEGHNVKAMGSIKGSYNPPKYIK